ncbi:hypothetical protein QF047_004164 [Arthrobacter sp. W4I7]|nr:hypothetical protein [Arthrobacter sp. W4I7]
MTNYAGNDIWFHGKFFVPWELVLKKGPLGIRISLRVHILAEAFCRDYYVSLPVWCEECVGILVEPPRQEFGRKEARGTKSILFI